MKKIITISFILFQLQFVVAQDIQFTQFYSAPMYLNPAFAGANACSKITLIYRNQWPGISSVYKSQLLSIDHGIKNSNVGIGLTFGRDEAGAGDLTTTIINPVISYQAKINKTSAIRFGLQPGFGFKKVNVNNLVFGDQIYRGGNVSTVESLGQKKSYFDLAVGAIYINSNYWAGISANHLTVPNESFYNNPFNKLPIKYSVHAGAKFDLSKDEKERRDKKYISPAINYRAEGKYDQIDIGFYFSKHIFTTGLWYRGIPGLKSYKKGYANNDAIAIILGIQTERISIGYSYDLTISNLSTVSKGAHEITMSFQLCNPKKRKTKLVLISCPKF
ncbi:PorP/SprF family type IX secretion system membrane protein [Aurantibacillus circumpalustris]|uniref:PorP/SprF family type IX secretion system membrane protein n=1 Tax=Aurantibacillus circumpalustris TaxID=3036359 RepID=UPI00295C189B|nr:type IX secretion system membrane protein PorP/SprF [Aurantibacillus circumpalustris]